MDVRFYDFEFNRLAEFPRFISWNYDKKYCGFGNVEIHFPIKETEVIELLEKNLFLFFARLYHMHYTSFQTFALTLQW